MLLLFFQKQSVEANAFMATSEKVGKGAPSKDYCLSLVLYSFFFFFFFFFLAALWHMEFPAQGSFHASQVVVATSAAAAAMLDP